MQTRKSFFVLVVQGLVISAHGVAFSGPCWFSVFETDGKRRTGRLPSAPTRRLRTIARGESFALLWLSAFR